MAASELRKDVAQMEAKDEDVPSGGGKPLQASLIKGVRPVVIPQRTSLD